VRLFKERIRRGLAPAFPDTLLLCVPERSGRRLHGLWVGYQIASFLIALFGSSPTYRPQLRMGSRCSIFKLQKRNIPEIFPW
jgi:hypothetical protein